MRDYNDDYIPPAVQQSPNSSPSAGSRNAKPSNSNRPQGGSPPRVGELDYDLEKPPMYRPSPDDKRSKPASPLERQLSSSWERLKNANVVAKHEGYPPMQIQRMGTQRVNLYAEIPVTYRPWFTYLMVVANCFMFLYTMYVANFQFESLNVNPLFGPSTAVLVKLGAKWYPYIIAGDWWRLIAPMFLHAGLVHLGFNMLTLWRIGSSIEETFGLFRTALIYLLSGVSGVVASCVFNPSTVGVGASGAIYGLVGALFGDFFQNHKTIVEGKCVYFLNLVFSLAFGIALGLLPIIDNWAHIGGLVAGFLLGLMLLTNNERDESGKRLLPWYSSALVILASIATFAWFVAMFALLYSNKNGNSYCTWCHYLDCVVINSSWWTC